MLTRSKLLPQLRAAGLHLLLSLAVATLAAVLWYPGIYRLLAGGGELFLLVVGPLSDLTYKIVTS